MLPAEKPAEPQAKPQPVVKPTPVQPKPIPTPKTPTPQIEATTSSIPSPSAPVVAPPETKPTPPGPPAAEPVSQARFDADYLRNPSPPYPPLAKRMGEEGKVLLRVSVNPQGTADSVEIKTSSGSTRLDESAQKTVRNWRFIPAKRGDIPVQSWVLVPIIFKLEQ
nr:energy transducer TonB [Dechloromonas sp.]